MSALIETVPPTPTSPVRNSASSYQQIIVDWAELLTDEETGGSSILSYELDWDAG